MTTITLDQPRSAPTRGGDLPAKSIDAAAFVDAAALLGVSNDVASAAAANLATGAAVFLVVSGWMLAGKDTIAPLTLAELGATRTEHLSYAKALKDEVDEIFTTLREPRLAHQAKAKRLLVSVLMDRHALTEEQAEFFTTLLYDHVRAVPRLHARLRTPRIRRALQYHGTEVRRSADPDYWVKKALVPALGFLAEGKSVYFTDARFLNEITGSSRFGAFTVRVDISAGEQLRRLLARDGFGADADALAHISEHALDDYTGFDVRLSNEQPAADTVAQVVAALRTI